MKAKKNEVEVIEQMYCFKTGVFFGKKVKESEVLKCFAGSRLSKPDKDGMKVIEYDVPETAKYTMLSANTDPNETGIALSGLGLYIKSKIYFYDSEVYDAIFVGTKKDFKNLESYLAEFNAKPFLKIESEKQLTKLEDLEVAYIFDYTEWLEKAKKVTPTTVGKFIKDLFNSKRKFDYGSIANTIKLSTLAGFYAGENSKHGGITGFQASFIANSIYCELMHIKYGFYKVEIGDFYRKGDKELQSMLNPSLYTRKRFIDIAIEDLTDFSPWGQLEELAPVELMSCYIKKIQRAIDVLLGDFSEFDEYKSINFNLKKSEQKELDSYIKSKLKSIDCTNIKKLSIANKALTKYHALYKDYISEINYPMFKSSYGYKKRARIIYKFYKLFDEKYHIFDKIYIEDKEEIKEVDKLVSLMKAAQDKSLAEDAKCDCAGC